MAAQVNERRLAPEIVKVIAALRRRIRWHITWDGLLTAIIWLALTFWIGLALDYFPVLVWANELPYAVRLVGLSLIAAVLTLILYKLLLRRLFVPLRDRSMALLIERRYGNFQDALTTTIEMPNTANASAEEMMSTTRQQAADQTQAVEVQTLLQRKRLWKKAAWAVLLMVPVAGFYATNAEAFEIWLRRMYLLEDQPWPRTARVEMLGIQVERLSPRTGEISYTPIRLFDREDQTIKVALGSNVLVRVAADSRAKRIPDYCRLIYKLDDGSRGQVSLRKDGTLDKEQHQQQYAYIGRPFLGILGDIRFDVIGYDHRIRDFHILVVESPVVTETVLECVFPSYMVDTKSGQWTPREIAYRSSGVQIPAGSIIKLKMKSNKPLTRISIYETQRETETEIQPSDDGMSFTFEIEELLTSKTIEFTLHDRDEITSERPHRVFIGAVEDTPPEVNVVINGIGTAITPNARLPIEGTVKDDYAVAESWFEYRLEENEPAKLPFVLADETVENVALDFRDLRSDSPPVELVPGQKISIQVKVSDKMDLSGGPNIGKNDLVTLDIVTSDELIAMLERREYAQRRTFEHVLDELTQTRDTLIRLRESLAGRDNDLLDADDDLDAEEIVIRRQALSVLRVQQSLRQSEKSRQETAAVAGSFYFIREELVNNRVDAEDRQQRLKEQIADPLMEITTTRFPELDNELQILLDQLTERKEASAVEAVDAANRLLADLNTVLESMLDIETYNEIIEIVRSLIEDQGEVIKETRKQRRKAALDLIE
jgi:uncharacterized membrane protein